MSNFPSIHKMQRNLWLFGWLKIPMIAFCRPKIVHWDENKVVIKIKRSRRTNNHLKSMYFGALMVGADLAAGMHAFAQISTQKKKISLAFKSCQAEFLQRPETDVYFTTEAGEMVKEMIRISEDTQQRVNQMVAVRITDEAGVEVANVTMELSLKVK
jgi:acyl-coenzyme A thioesterase PaaI-like protein